ncbi:MAG TPA: hypothetical protein VGQ68_07110 [Gaiellaceae bacterium]|jgi:hypothetical protein|nr:hypothetical protein [Gaiellaceae bacterium]
MNGPNHGTLRGAAPRLLLGAALLLGGGLLAVTTGARGVPQARAAAAAAAINLTQTCSTRVKPRALVEVSTTVANTGDVPFTTLVVDGDAGTPNDESDDFLLAYQSGDTGPPTLDPGETWTYTGGYQAQAEDTTNVVGADATTVVGEIVSDLDPCTTDVIQVPQPGEIAGVAPVSGHVLFKTPDSNKFVELTGATEIPVGSQLNTLNGTVHLTAGLGGGRTNSANFYDGLFTILQHHAANAFMTLRLDGGNFRICRRGGSARSLSAVGRKRRPVRRVWGSGKGRFTTRGRYSSATVRGTRWLTQDQCDGTLTRVRRGVVRVRDFRRHRNVIVRAGQSYLARAPGA